MKIINHIINFFSLRVLQSACIAFLLKYGNKFWFFSYCVVVAIPPIFLLLVSIVKKYDNEAVEISKREKSVLWTEVSLQCIYLATSLYLLFSFGYASAGWWALACYLYTQYIVIVKLYPLAK